MSNKKKMQKRGFPTCADMGKGSYAPPQNKSILPPAKQPSPAWKPAELYPTAATKYLQ